jgi:hypothetical protein
VCFQTYRLGDTFPNQGHSTIDEMNRGTNNSINSNKHKNIHHAIGQDLCEERHEQGYTVASPTVKVVCDMGCQTFRHEMSANSM